MRQFLRNLFYILIATLASLLFMPLNFIIAFYTACKLYRDYLGSYMQLEAEE